MKRGAITEVTIPFSRLEARPCDAERLGVPVLEAQLGPCTYLAYRQWQGRLEPWCFGKAKHLNTRSGGYKYNAMLIAFSYAFPPEAFCAMTYALALDYYRGPRGEDRSSRRRGLSPEEAAWKDAYRGAYSRLESVLIRSWRELHGGCDLPGQVGGLTGHRSSHCYLQSLRAQFKGNLVGNLRVIISRI
jgi:hypothetical protein